MAGMCVIVALTLAAFVGLAIFATGRNQPDDPEDAIDPRP